jgi:MFS transporter, CP family, cyanate transporter
VTETFNREQTAIAAYGEFSAYRWVNLAVYALLLASMGSALFGPAALVASYGEQFGVGFARANLALVVLSGLMPALLAFPAGIACDRFGFKIPTLAGATLLSAGALARASAASWLPFILANMVLAAGAGSMQSGQGSLIRTWFPRRDTGVANGTLNLSIALGTAAGQGLSLALVQEIGWKATWIGLASIPTAVTLLGWVLLRNPQNTLITDSSRERTNPLPEIRQGLRQAMNRTNVVILFVTLATMSVIASAPALFPLVLQGHGLELGPIGMIVAAFSLAGMATMIPLPAWALSRGRGGIGMATCMGTGAGLFLLMFYLPAKQDTVWLPLVVSAGAGGSLYPVQTLLLSIAMLQPGVTDKNAGMLMGAIITVLGLAYVGLPGIVGVIVERAGPIPGAWLLALVLFGVALVAGVWVREPQL